MIEIILHKLGRKGMEGRVVKWLKQEGSIVEKGEPIVEVETEKTIHTIAAKGSGTLQVWVPVGSVIPIGGVLAVINEKCGC
jgi:pyruvate dehydrogenase E2 component (dihydrolipoamide acetyltransferase)